MILQARSRFILSRSVRFFSGRTKVGTLKIPFYQSTGCPLLVEGQKLRIYQPFFIPGLLGELKHGFLMNYQEKQLEILLTENYLERKMEYEGDNFFIKGTSVSHWEVFQNQNFIGSIKISKKIFNPAHEMDLPENIPLAVQIFLFSSCFFHIPASGGY